MANYGGVEQFVTAVTGGPALEAAYANQAINRLVKQRSAMALLDKRLADAVKSREVAAAYQNLRGSQPPGRNTDILLGGLGGSFSGLQTGLGKEQQNLARGVQLEALLQAITNGNAPPDPDMMNAITAVTSGKMLGPGNVNVEGQSSATMGATEARGQASTAAAELSRGRLEALQAKTPLEEAALQALENQRNASADRSRTGGRVNMEPINTTQAYDLQMDVPILTGKGGNLRVKEENQYLLSDFNRWRASNVTVDPNLADSDYAVQKYREMKEAEFAKTRDLAKRAAELKSTKAAAPGNTISFVRGPDGSLILAQ